MSPIRHTPPFQNPACLLLTHAHFGSPPAPRFDPVPLTSNACPPTSNTHPLTSNVSANARPHFERTPTSQAPLPLTCPRPTCTSRFERPPTCPLRTPMPRLRNSCFECSFECPHAPFQHASPQNARPPTSNAGTPVFALRSSARPFTTTSKGLNAFMLSLAPKPLLHFERPPPCTSNALPLRTPLAPQMWALLPTCRCPLNAAHFERPLAHFECVGKHPPALRTFPHCASLPPHAHFKHACPPAQFQRPLAHFQHTHALFGRRPHRNSNERTPFEWSRVPALQTPARPLQTCLRKTTATFGIAIETPTHCPLHIKDDHAGTMRKFCWSHLLL
ncbi:hypothetical protein K438DRAFT_1040267 [Mycena galopus ATCC 62051]|nr:hypothetical protein K438DRAFT_1040267 [Mycena galopus ATCC 62051]